MMRKTLLRRAVGVTDFGGPTRRISSQGFTSAVAVFLRLRSQRCGVTGVSRGGGRCEPCRRRTALSESGDVKAYISECETYRYSLTRDVAPLTGAGTVTFVMLNPSTADAEQDDPTIRRCIRFARDWGFARLKVVNLYAYRTTNPRQLKTVADPVGPENDCTIAKVIGGSDLVVCAWGANNANGRGEKVLDLIAAPHALGVTDGGMPRHPLYVKANTLPAPFSHCPPQASWAAHSQASADK
jgi:hypothetical protein